MLRAPQFLARTDTNASRTATALARGGQDAVVINMGDLSGGANSETNKKDKKQDSLFGPNIGVISAGPKWTESNEKNLVEDQLTPDVVNTWISKSKEASQPTTTLQALVNLKRPTLRLSPLAVSPDDDATNIDSQHHHGLEFEYDCDAPKCGINVYVLLDADTEQDDGRKLSKVMVFESTVDGGFGKVLKLEEGATLELGRFENKTKTEPVATEVQPGNSGSNGEAGPAGSLSPDIPAQRKRRFTSTFPFRKRLQGRHVSGPALAVVDADPVPSASVDATKKEEDDETDEEGVKVVIHLTALDKEGTELGNEQVTYLHVVRFGERVKSEENEEKEKEKDSVEDDKRPWVVKVVKREATIGPHTFHLHEIYGLSSHSAINPPPAISPVSSPTYPPTAPLPSTQEDPSPASECLLCLSSPREVVLLPCRHLVACRECALNMVEFGAGGTITQAAEDIPTGGDGAATDAVVDMPDGAAGAAAPSGTLAATPTPTPTATTRRKRKPKGWFCPVCRQPYTSLLRLTTNPPVPATSDEDIDGKEVDSPESPTATELPSSGSPVSGRARSYRPSFLRGLSRAGNQPAENSPATSTLPPDLERGTVTA